MKELNILDLRFGFYVKNYPYGQSPRSKLAHPGQNMTIVHIKCWFLKHRFLAFPEVLEGLGSSGMLVGIISTYPGTSPTPWCRVMAKKPPAHLVHPPQKGAPQ